jgi:hypothetical protein
MEIFPTDEDIEWLKEDLAGNRDKRVVFFTHRLVTATKMVIFAFKKAGVKCLMPKAEKVRNILKKHGNVAMVLSGHVHMDLYMTRDDVDTVFISTEALCEPLHQFKLFKVYPGRVEVFQFAGRDAGRIEKGKWTSRHLRMINLPCTSP